MGKGWQRICPRQENGIYYCDYTYDGRKFQASVML